MSKKTVDTNILVRIFAKDDSSQWQVAADLLNSNEIVILSTVLLETEWVLRKRMALDTATIIDLFKAMLASDTITFVERDRVSSAVDAFAAGMDFADALHVCGTAADSTFVSFDRDLIRLANRNMSKINVELAQQK